MANGNGSSHWVVSQFVDVSLFLFAFEHKIRSESIIDRSTEQLTRHIGPIRASSTFDFCLIWLHHPHLYHRRQQTEKTNEKKIYEFYHRSLLFFMIFIVEIYFFFFDISPWKTEGKQNEKKKKGFSWTYLFLIKIINGWDWSS